MPEQPQAPAQPADDKTSQAFSTYLSARFAAGEHDLPEAARYYGQSLNNDPGNPSLLALSFFYSTTAGDFESAGKYAQAVVDATPDDRAARLALAVIGFKHKDYAEVRKQLALSAKGPFTVLTLSLFDAWAAAAQHDGAGVEKDLAALTAQKGAESMAMFHTALMPGLFRQQQPGRRRLQKGAGLGGADAAGAGRLWPLPGTPGPGAGRRQALPATCQRRRACQCRAAGPGPHRRRARSPKP